MQDNFKRYGFVSTLDELFDEIRNDILDRPSMREMVDNQKNTRNAIGLYNILDGVAGFGNIEIFQTYYPLLYEVAAAIKREYGYTNIEYKSLMVVKLLAGGDIAEHIDEAGIYNYAHRVHVPVITNEDVIFTIGDEKGRMSAGEIVEIKNTVPHSVINGGADRVHIIMDIVGLHNGYNERVLNHPVPKQFYFEEN